MSDNDDIDAKANTFDAAAYKRDRQLAIQEGTWQPFVPAPKVADHILELKAQGMSLRAVGAAAGVSAQRIGTIAAGGSINVKAEIAARILNVTFDADAADRQAPWITRRRIGALMAKGWPQTKIAEIAGVNINHLNMMMRASGRVETIPKSTVQGVKTAYEQLADQDGPKALPKKLARTLGYPPPEAWTPDELEDPEPSTIHRIYKRWNDAHPLRWHERLHASRETNGYTVAEAAEKLDVTQGSIWAWEQGDRVPKNKIRARVAKLYGETEDYLFRD